MKNNTIYTALALAMAAIGAVLYAVLLYTGTTTSVAPLASTGVWLSLLALGTLSLLPLACKCKKDGLCKAVKNYVPAVIMAALGNLVGTGLIQLFTTAGRLSTTISQIVAVFFGILLLAIWGFFLYAAITGALCPDEKCGCDHNPPGDNCDDFSYNDKKYKY